MIYLNILQICLIVALVYLSVLSAIVGAYSALAFSLGAIAISAPVVWHTNFFLHELIEKWFRR